MKYAFRLQYPPTVNTYYRSYVPPGWKRACVALSERGKAYQTAAMEFRPTAPLLGRLGVDLRVMMPDRKVRDLDNILKPVLDAITNAQIWSDDCQVDRLLVERVGVRRPGWVDVVIEQLGLTNGG